MQEWQRKWNHKCCMDIWLLCEEIPNEGNFGLRSPKQTPQAQGILLGKTENMLYRAFTTCASQARVEANAGGGMLQYGRTTTQAGPRLTESCKTQDQAGRRMLA